VIREAKKRPQGWKAPVAAISKKDAKKNAADAKKAEAKTDAKK